MSPEAHLLLQEFSNKQISRDQLHDRTVNNFNLIPELLQGILSKKASVRYGCAKILNDLSSEYPEKIYPYFNEFFNLLDSKYRILTWNAMAIIANLAPIDIEKKLDANFEKLFVFINNDYMVTVANVVGASAKIAQAKPYLIPKIAAELLKVQNISTGPHLTEECKRVIAEKTVESFSLFFDKVPAKDRPSILAFVNGCVNSPRKTLKIKAETFLKQWSKTP